ncbi:aminoglycoside phosphotransferase family protein [Spirillospora sp. CA-294931]|uniref:aminoglycoside phosphotransferase family protein n=1 Tax=Spirillospora sp. CA-294931 TaxID=3240042 RepID=UPI003D8D393E
MTKIEIPAALVESQTEFNGDEGVAWVERLPGLASGCLERWDLRLDGAPLNGLASLILPVLRADGESAMLKLQLMDDETEGEPVALRAWGGQGAVRLLEDAPEDGAMLLERVRPGHTLLTVADETEALTILTGVLGRLVEHPAPPELRTLRDVAHAMLAEAPAALEKLVDDEERELSRACAARLAELADEPGDRLLHWDLHYENVLASTREPWVAIDPKPLAGDPGFDLLPALHNRWDEVEASGDVHRAVRRRFDLMTEMLGLDRERAAGWTLARVLQNTLWEIEDGDDEMSEVQYLVGEAMLKI